MKKGKKAKHFVQKPIYEGGPAALKKFISQNLRYPKEALIKKIEGTVALKYTINHLGKVVAVKIISTIGGGCEEEAKRLVQLLTFKMPRNRGVKAIFHKDLQIHFRLPPVKAVTEQTMTLKYQVVPTKNNPPKTSPEPNGYTIYY